MSIKLLLIALAACLIAITGVQFLYNEKSSLRSVEINESKQKWEQYKQTYNKQFSSEEEAYRYNIFQNNIKMIEQLKQKETQAEFKLNEFAHLSQEEFKNRYFIPVTTPSLLEFSSQPIKGNPTSVDWRTQGIVGPVKNMGQMSNIKVLATVDVCTSHNAQQSGTLVELSVQQVTDCSTADIFSYAHTKGLESDADYPSQSSGTCKYDASKVIYRCQGAITVPQNNLDALETGVAMRPVLAAVEADTWQFYAGGILTQCGTNVDHMISIVGYDKTQSYWIMRNFWGTAWGESGYIRVKKNVGQGSGICGEAMYAQYPY